MNSSNLLHVVSCFCGGYALNMMYINASYFAAKRLGLPTNPYKGGSYEVELQQNVA